MKEEWRDIEGYEGRYQISNLGRVKSFYKGGGILKDKITKCGYKQVVLVIRGYRKTMYVHRLVAQAFIKHCDNRLEVNHIDGNKINNCSTNLEWVTRT